MHRGTLWLILALPFILAAEPKRMKYPVSRVEKVVDNIHGVDVPDPYRWLEKGDDPAVVDWAAQQNALTRSVLDAVPGRAGIRQRLDSLLDIGAVGVPAVRKHRYFYTRREGKQDQAVLYVRDGLRGTDRVLIDPNALAKDGTVALDWWYPSRDGNRLAYGLSAAGSERSTLYVRDVDTGKDLAERIPHTRACAVAWLPDGSGFYYTRFPDPSSVAKDEADYHRHVYIHKLGNDSSKDLRVFGEGRAPTDWPDVSLSPDGRWLVVTVYQGFTKAEVYYKDLTDDNAKFVTLAAGEDALYSVTPRADAFYVVTNEKAPRYRLVRVDPLKPDRQHWVELIRESDDVLDGIAHVGSTIAAQYLHKAYSLLKLHDMHGKHVREITLPTLGEITGLSGEWDGTELFYGFHSFTRPTSIHRIDLAASPPTPTELWERVRSEVDFSGYDVEQVTVKSKDGTDVTMFLAGKKGFARDGARPTLLYGYGGFGVSMSPSFAASRFLFFERGGVMAIANLRGGGEYGESWHKAGMLARKQNVFDDFIAAAEWLIREKVTSPDRLAIQGGSNGGLLMGAALTQRPDLFRCVVCQVPLLDMVRYPQFLIAKLWIPEYGDPGKAEEFRWLYAYSPYHKLRAGTRYPAVLLMTAETDTRVDPLHARKMTAALQATQAGDRPVLLRQEPKAGHGAGKPRSKVLDELTDVWSFVLSQLDQAGK